MLFAAQADSCHHFIRREEKMNYIFLHGLGQTASSWRDTINAIDGQYSILCPQIFNGFAAQLRHILIFIRHWNNTAGNGMIL